MINIKLLIFKIVFYLCFQFFHLYYQWWYHPPNCMMINIKLLILNGISTSASSFSTSLAKFLMWIMWWLKCYLWSYQVCYAEDGIWPLPLVVPLPWPTFWISPPALHSPVVKSWLRRKRFVLHVMLFQICSPELGHKSLVCLFFWPNVKIPEKPLPSYVDTKWHLSRIIPKQID